MMPLHHPQEEEEEAAMDRASRSSTPVMKGITKSSLTTVDPLFQDSRAALVILLQEEGRMGNQGRR